MNAEATAPVLVVDGLSKAFGQNHALDEVSLEVRSGSVHALLGMNGSGKSTLVKVLSGFHKADRGTVTVLPRDGHSEGGIAFVHQDLGLIPSMTVLENMTLGRRPVTRGLVIDRKTERARAAEALAPFQLESRLDERVAVLSRAEATILAIARAIASSNDVPVSVIVMDEPTSALPSAEATRLLGIIRSLANQGYGVLFISHRLKEVEVACDAVTVLKNGRVVHEGRGTPKVGDLVLAMTGEAELTEDRAQETTAASTSSDRLIAHAVSGARVRDTSFTAHGGEIVGVVGLLGSGIDEFGMLLSGRTPPIAGRVELNGQKLSSTTGNRVGYLPADRPNLALLTGLTARENASVRAERRYTRRGTISTHREARDVSAWFDRLNVHPNNRELEIGGFSGGNQQKVLFARWLLRAPNVIVADEPTQGVDVHAKAQILHAVRDFTRDGGVAVLLSGEPDEIIHACDRVLIMVDGQIVAERSAPYSAEEILSLMHKEKAS